MTAAFITVPLAPNGRNEISINVEEIATYRSHHIAADEEWTVVTLRAGSGSHDLLLTKDEFADRLCLVAALASEIEETR